MLQKGTAYLKDNASRLRHDAKPEGTVEPKDDCERQVKEDLHQEYARKCAPAEPVVWYADRLARAAEPQHCRGGEHHDAKPEGEPHRANCEDAGHHYDDALHKMHERRSDASLANGAVLNVAMRGKNIGRHSCGVPRPSGLHALVNIVCTDRRDGAVEGTGTGTDTPTRSVGAFGGVEYRYSTGRDSKAHARAGGKRTA